MTHYRPAIAHVGREILVYIASAGHGCCRRVPHVLDAKFLSTSHPPGTDVVVVYRMAAQSWDQNAHKECPIRGLSSSSCTDNFGFII